MSRFYPLLEHSSQVRLGSGLPAKILFVHGSLTMLVPYLHTRIRDYALSHAWPDAPSSDRRRKAWEFLGRLESIHGLLGLGNFILFLLNGRYVNLFISAWLFPDHTSLIIRYRTLADRVTRMRLIPARQLSRREVSYEFMNRQMVWHAFTVRGELIVLLVLYWTYYSSGIFVIPTATD